MAPAPTQAVDLERATPAAPPGQDASDRPDGPTPRHRRWRRPALVLGALAAAGLAAWFLVPYVRTALSTVSTDDAYVNGHFTSVAPRVEGQVVRVLVDDNMRVRPGQLLVQLDPEPYRVIVEQRRALLEVAKADLRQAEAKVRALEGTARSRRWRLQNAIEQVRNQVASLRASVAVLESRRATVSRARADYERAERLFARGAVSREELDARQEAIRVADAQANEALAQVQEVRVGLGLPGTPPDDRPLTDVPADLPETFSTVRVALADLVQTVAELGLPLARSEATPTEALEEFRRLDTSGDIDAILRRLVTEAPAYKQAEAAVLRARRDLDQAELNLSYTDIVADIAGVISRRTVNPGNNVRAGQGLMAIRSVQDIWIDANFKETQIADLRIGQPVDLYADAYGSRRVYKGRITGFSMGTGSTLALLPPQNATGNFVKVVQRLPVRIDLEHGNPEDAPLFLGLSIVPYVRIYDRPSGPNAGQFLQAPLEPVATAPEIADPRRADLGRGLDASASRGGGAVQGGGATQGGGSALGRGAAPGGESTRGGGPR